MEIMNLDLALSVMRTGEGDLRKIIEYYAATGMECELIPYLDEADISPTVLYVISELPRVQQKMLSEIEMRFESGSIPDSARAWAEEILLNHR